MDLRGCSRMHFISIIRGGGVIKVPNIVRGKPGPKLLSIEEINTSVDSRCNDSLAKHPVKVDRSLAMPWDFEVKTESVEEDELDFGSTTLKQLKDIFNSRKRKASSSVDLTVVKVEEDDDLQREEDGLDLKETLTSLKKIMKSKGRKKGISCRKLCEPLKIKVEEAEFEYSQLQARSSTLNDDPPNLTRHTVRAVEHCCPDEELNVTSGYLQSDLDQHSNAHFLHPVSIENPSCYLNQVSYDFLDDSEPQNPLMSDYPKIEENMKVDSSVVIGDQSLLYCGSGVKSESDSTDLMAYDAPMETVLFEHDKSDFEDQNIHHPDGNSSTEIHVPCMVPNGDCRNAEITTLGEAVELANDNQDIVGEVRKPATNCNSGVHSDNFCLDNISTAVEDEQSPVLAVATEEASASSLVPESNFHDTELINHVESSRSFADNACSEAKTLKRDCNNCDVLLEDDNCLPLVNSMDSLHIATSAEDDNQISTHDNDVSPPVCSPQIQPCAAIDHKIGSGASEGNYGNKLLQQPPEKLFSARRKTISPNSKVRLCQAMDLAEMQDDQILSCKEKLSFEENSVDASSLRPKVKKARVILTSKRMETLRNSDIRSTTRQKNLSFVKGTGRGGHASPSLHAGNQCNSSLSCSQNAIAFSQQQMVDIERLAVKLLTELHSMKEIVVDSLQSESRMCTTSKSNTDKAKVAVENVKKVEETTKRWLSIMSRDCHRFCKILEVSETNGSSPEKSNDKCTPEKAEKCQNNPSLEKKQDEKELSPLRSTVSREKKIMFADEAGDSLCHVKVLEAKY